MTPDIQHLLGRILIMSVAAIIFGTWGGYWYRHAADLDRMMTEDWLAKLMRIEDRMPKEKRIRAFRRQSKVTISTFAVIEAPKGVH